MMRRLVAVLIVAGIAAGGMWACGDSTDPDSIAGTYNLQTVDGESLPIILGGGGDNMVELASAFERLNDDGTFLESSTFRLTEDGDVSTDVETSDGSWTQSGTAITFTYTGGGTFTGSISGNTLTTTQQGFTLVFRK